MPGLGRLRPLAALAMVGAGCSLGPRQFADLHDPAPLVRARAAGLADERPRAEAIPELIDRLDDPDAVVRLAAHEELRRRTGQEFGYRPWDDAPERDAAAARWYAWWDGQAGAAEPSPSPAPRPEATGAEVPPPPPRAAAEPEDES